MRPPITGRSQWGGWGEALCVAHQWNLQVAIFVSFPDGSLSLCVGPAGPVGASGTMCLLWSGTHYDAIQLTPPADVSQLFPATWTSQATSALRDEMLSHHAAVTVAAVAALLSLLMSLLLLRLFCCFVVAVGLDVARCSLPLLWLLLLWALLLLLLLLLLWL